MTKPKLLDNAGEKKMPDIAMCCNDMCPLRNDCYRYKATPSEMQSYAFFDYEDGERGSFCRDRVPMKKS